MNSFDDEDISGALAEKSSLSSSSMSQQRERLPEEANQDGRETVRDVAEATERSLRQSHAESNGNSSNGAADEDFSIAELQDRRGDRARESEDGEAESEEGWFGWAKGWLPWNRSEQADEHDDSLIKPAEVPSTPLEPALLPVYNESSVASSLCRTSAHLPYARYAVGSPPVW